MTIQQIFTKHSEHISLSDGNYGYFLDESDFTNAARELIKYHVQAALLQASENVETMFDDGQCEISEAYSVDRDSILNSYPLDLIK